jgi:hypothetical protein
MKWLRPIALGAALTAGCSVPPSDSRYVQTSLPDEASFQPVAQLLSFRCGTADCHGTVYRNLRIYGSSGLRWSASDRPLVPPCDTTDEIDQDYLSVVGLEPATMSAVVADHGADPERLTMVRKARGTEAHKAGTIWAEGSDPDVCLTSWLAGAVDRQACTTAIDALLPTDSTDPVSACVSP